MKSSHVILKLVAPWSLNGLIVSLLWQIHPMPHLSDDHVQYVGSLSVSGLQINNIFNRCMYCINTTWQPVQHNYTAFVTNKPVTSAAFTPNEIFNMTFTHFDKLQE